MISSEVQRTLVKSPPELWAELSDPAALARHLGELGDIRIVRTEPESTVEWAAENTTGTVSIKPSGWGTKVTLSVTRQTPAPAPLEPSPDPAPALEPSLELPAALKPGATPGPSPDAPEPEADAPEPEAARAATSAPEALAEPVPTPAPASEPTPELEPRRGFFARLFGRRRREALSGPAKQTVAVAPADPSQDEPAPGAPDAFAAVRAALAPETFAAEHPFVAAPEVKQPVPEPAATEPGPTASEPEPDIYPEKADDISAELMAAEEAGTEEVTAVLTAVLDRLGAAHHRPFSRS